MEIHEKIKQLREAKRISGSEIAGRLNMSPQNYWNIETGKVELTVKRLSDIAGILETSPFELLTGERPKVEENTEVVEGLKKEVQRLEKIQALQDDKLTNLSKYFLERIRDKVKGYLLDFAGLKEQRQFLSFSLSRYNGSLPDDNIDSCIESVSFINLNGFKNFSTKSIDDSRALWLLTKYIYDEKIQDKVPYNMFKINVSSIDTLDPLLDLILIEIKERCSKVENMKKDSGFFVNNKELALEIMDYETQTIIKVKGQSESKKQELLNTWRSDFSNVSEHDIVFELNIRNDKWGLVYELVSKEFREDIFEILQSNVIIGNEELYRAFRPD